MTVRSFARSHAALVQHKSSDLDIGQGRQSTGNGESDRALGVCKRSSAEGFSSVNPRVTRGAGVVPHGQYSACQGSSPRATGA